MTIPNPNDALDFSEFAQRIRRLYPEWVERLGADGSLTRAMLLPELDALPEALAQATSDDDIRQRLRACRNQSHYRILVQDVHRLISVDQVLELTTRVADEVLQQAISLAAARLEKRHGTVTDRAGEPLSLVVMGMGKLGGRELNVSSDIDLVFACRQSGQTTGPRSISAEEFFTRQIRLITGWLSASQHDGFCYRVDLRLRPYGDAGRLIMTVDAMEQYFQREGRDWERYAWIKARPVAGDLETGEALLKMLRPFIYRRYLDYNAFDSLREMKALIMAESAPGPMQNHLKLGPGGIRDIEFIVQSFQLIRGGQDPALRQRSLLATLGYLSESELLEPDEGAALAAAYRYLRVLENRVQQIDDQQVHTLPEDEALLSAIARSIGHASASDMLDELARHRRAVSHSFARVIGPASPQHDSDLDQQWQDIWRLRHLTDRHAEWLGRQGFEPPERVATLLEDFRQSHQYRMTGQRIRQRLDRLMPELVRLASRVPRSIQTLENVLLMMQTISTRGPYVALLAERPAVLERLVDLCSQSRWLATTLAAQPSLLDELITPKTLPRAQSRQAIEQMIGERLGQAEGEEQEQHVLRAVQKRWQSAWVVAYAADQMTAASMSRSLAELADVMIGIELDLARRDIAARYQIDHEALDDLLVIGYGSLGSREMTLDSDLDLIFIIDPSTAAFERPGHDPVPVEQVYTRVVQRFMHLLTMRLANGRLYDVDLRLRPNGNSGLMISRLTAYRDYQLNQAWTWELQALIRSRAVAGSAVMQPQFDAIRREVLCTGRTLSVIHRDILSMREKMRAELDQSDDDQFDIKQGRGGRADIEFLCQWWTLQHSAGQDADTHLIARSTLDILASLAGLAETSAVRQTQIATLMTAFEFWLDRQHQACLQGRRGVLSDLSIETRGLWQRCREMAESVAEIWDQVSAESVDEGSDTSS